MAALQTKVPTAKLNDGTEIPMVQQSRLPCSYG